MDRSQLARKGLFALLGLSALAGLTGGAVAQSSAAPGGSAANPDAARWYLQTSAYTRHFNPDPAHVNTQQLINIERIDSENRLIGAAFFRNSFGQPSQMVYFGKRWHPLERHPEMHVKLVAGVLHGYKGEYRDKIPFNSSGYAPVVLPAIGYTYKRFASELILFGNSGLLVTVGYHLN